MSIEDPPHRRRLRGRSATVGLVALALVIVAATAAIAATGGSAGGPRELSAVSVAQSDGTPSLPPAGTPAPGTTVPSPGTTGPAPGITGPVPVVPSGVTAERVIKLPSARRCVRSLRIRFVGRVTFGLRSLSIRAGSRRVKRTRVPSSIRLRVLPRKRFTLRVSVRVSSGKALVRTRRYRPCR